MKGNVLMVSPKTTTVVAGLMALGIAGVAATSFAKDWTKQIKAEKCYGVAKAGKNDCATKSHQCAGMSKMDNDPDSWIFLPAGVCEKLGGHVMDGKMMKKDDMKKEM